MRIPIAVVLGAAAVCASPALAQQQGLINVDISNVRTEIAKNLNVNVSQIPVTAQVPIGVAANICGVNANVLAQQGRGGSAACAARNTSQALNQFVQRQSLNQNLGRGQGATQQGARQQSPTGMQSGTRQSPTKSGTAATTPRGSATTPRTGGSTLGSAPSGTRSTTGSSAPLSGGSGSVGGSGGSLGGGGGSLGGGGGGGSAGGMGGGGMGGGGGGGR